MCNSIINETSMKPVKGGSALDKKKTNIEIVDTDIFSIGTDGGNKPIKPINLDKNKPKVDYSKPVEPIMTADNVIVGYKNVQNKPKELECWEKEFDKKFGNNLELNEGMIGTAVEEYHSNATRKVKNFISKTLTQQRTELNREWNSKLLLSQREMINSFKNKDEGVKNWEDEYFRRYQDGLWSDADSLAVDKSSEVKEFIKETVMEIRTELLEEIKTRIDTWGGFEDDGGNLCHYDSEILEWVNDLLNNKNE
jgi:hypothetical protein